MPQAPDRTQSHSTTQENQGAEWHVAAGTASSPRAKFLYRLHAPQRWWSESIWRIVAQEIRACPQRIAAALRNPHLRLGYCLWSAREDHSTGNLYEVSEFARACKSDMEKLGDNHPWLSVLDFDILSQSYRLGVAWAFRTMSPRIEMCDAVSASSLVSALSCDQLSEVQDGETDNQGANSRGDAEGRIRTPEIIGHATRRQS